MGDYHPPGQLLFPWAPEATRFGFLVTRFFLVSDFGDRCSGRWPFEGGGGTDVLAGVCKNI